MCERDLADHELLAGAIVFMVVAVPFVLPVLLPLVVGFVILRKRYIMTSREVSLQLQSGF